MDRNTVDRLWFLLSLLREAQGVADTLPDVNKLSHFGQTIGTLIEFLDWQIHVAETQLKFQLGRDGKDGLLFC